MEVNSDKYRKCATYICDTSKDDVHFEPNSFLHDSSGHSLISTRIEIHIDQRENKMPSPIFTK